MTQKTRILLVFLSLALLSMPLVVAHAQSENPFRSTDYPLPRYVSLNSDKVYVRTGPGPKYPIKWVYKKRALPVEIVLEYDVWRKIRDFDGDSGWVNKTLLVGKRTALVMSNGLVNMYKKPNNQSKIMASLEPKLLVHVDSCDSDWCEIKVSGYKGWVQQNVLWGVYEGEKFD